MSSPTVAAVRRTAALVVSGITLLTAMAAAGLVAGLALAGPAAADVPEGWDEPPAIDRLEALLLLGGIPLLLFVAILALVYLPALVRGERVAPGAPAIDNQWLGGPRKTTGELAAADSEQSQAGGASGRW